jgi:class 3 adenylate cyclase
MPDLPTGTVTFVFSDLEGSTRLLKQLGDDGYAEMLRTHRRIVRETFAAHGGSEIDTQGDAFFYSFSRARGAVAAAVEVQRRHETQAWPGGNKVRVRLGLHTGEPVVGEEGYTGLDVVRAARIAADGEGGQILLSEATRAIVGDDLPEGVAVRELGARTLKDIDKPEPLYELVYGAPPEGEPASGPAVPAPPPPTDLTSVDSWLKIASEAIRSGGDYDPGPLIEQRVLSQIERNMSAHNARRFERSIGKDKKKGKSVEDPSHSAQVPPGVPSFAGPASIPGLGEPPKSRSVADEIDRLRTLHDQGALTDEQFSKAVDRVLAEG